LIQKNYFYEIAHNVPTKKTIRNFVIQSTSIVSSLSLFSYICLCFFRSCFVLIYENIVVVGVVSASSLKDCLRNKRLLLLPLLWVCLLFVLTPRELILLEEAGVKYQKNLFENHK